MKVATALPPLLVEVEHKYAEAKTLSAKFKQINLTASVSQTKTSTRGLLKLASARSAGKLLSDKSLMLSDGRLFWFLRHRLTRVKTDSSLSVSGHPLTLSASLATGAFSMARDMKIDRESASLYTLILKGSAGTVQEGQNSNRSHEPPHHAVKSALCGRKPRGDHAY